jgi:hypothetical protein
MTVFILVHVRFDFARTNIMVTFKVLLGSFPYNFMNIKIMSARNVYMICALQEYDATALVKKYNGPKTTILIDQVSFVNKGQRPCDVVVIHR